MFEVRAELALEDRTPFELALTLQAEGFQWQLLPPKKDDRKQLYHVIGDQQQPRMWYTLSSCLVPQYMLCLLKASELAFYDEPGTHPDHARARAHRDTDTQTHTHTHRFRVHPHGKITRTRARTYTHPHSRVRAKAHPRARSNRRYGSVF